MPLPQLELWVEVEPSCNLHCQFCYNWWRDGLGPAPKRLPTSHLLSGLRRLSESAQYTSVTLSGGEPLLRNDLDSIAAFFSSLSVPIVLATNGALLYPARIQRLRDLGVKTFQIPLHSTSEDMHDFLAGGKSWRRALEALVDVREAGGNAVVVFVATRLNISHFSNVVALSGALGLRDVIFNRLIPSGMAAHNQAELGIPEDEEMLDVLLQAEPIARERDLTLHLGVPVAMDPDLRIQLKAVSHASCPVAQGQRRWTVGVDGTIRRCSHSSEAVGTLWDEGLRQLQEELRMQAPTTFNGQVQCCRIIQANAASNLVRLGKGGYSQRF